MAKKHELGFEHFEKSKGTMTNAEIAQLVGAAESTVRKWKSRYKWDEKMGFEKSVTPSENPNVTQKKGAPKKDVRSIQRDQVINSLVEAGTYSPALELLIDVYLDCYEEYDSAKKNGEGTEKLRKEMARLIGQLGLDGKNKELIKRSGVLLGKQDKQEEEKEQVPPNNKLLQFRQRVSK